MFAKTKNGGSAYKNRWSPAIWSAAAGLLLLPWVAMRFTGEVNWTLSDFVVFGAMLAAACSAYEVAARISGSAAYRAAAGVAVVAGFLLVWINLAVGIIGAETNRGNLMFAGILAVAIVGALIARFQPQAMAWALVATAIAHAAVGAIALVAWPDSTREVLGTTVIFVMLWLASAWLFRKAAR